MKHYVSTCRIMKGWFKGLENNENVRWNRIWDDKLDEEKNYVLTKLWKETEKIKEKKERKIMIKKKS